MRHKNRLTFVEAYRMLRGHSAFSLWQSIVYALWLTS